MVFSLCHPESRVMDYCPVHSESAEHSKNPGAMKDSSCLDSLDTVCPLSDGGGGLDSSDAKSILRVTCVVLTFFSRHCERSAACHVFSVGNLNRDSHVLTVLAVTSIPMEYSHSIVSEWPMILINIYPQNTIPSHCTQLSLMSKNINKLAEICEK